MSILRSLEFVTTVAEPQGLPPPLEPEIAFAGRSNAGKSSVINALAGRNRLAFVSKTPGRTQHINFFKVGSLGYLVDLPGYGYAKVPEAARAHWNELIGGYLQTRASLRGVILIMDARHPFTALDDQLLAWLRPTGLPIHILLSKCDKLTPAQGRNTLHNVTTLLQGNALYSAQLFSSTRKIGILEATAQIARWLTAENIKNPRLKGSKTGGKALIRIKAPAQGGKAGDDKIA